MAEGEEAPTNQVNALNAGQKVLDSFWALSSVDQEKRNGAIQLLLSEVAGNENPQAVQEYVLQRLMKGLGSGRGACRQGFAAALAAMLEAKQGISISRVLELMEEHLPATGSGKGTDQKNVLLGQLFTQAALAQAGRLTDQETAAASITTLLAISKKRSFLAESATSVVLDICDKLPRASLQEIMVSHEGLQAVLRTRAEDSTPESLLLALHLWPHMPDEVLSSCSMLPGAQGIKPPLDLFQASEEAAATDSEKASAGGKVSKRKNGAAGDVKQSGSQQRAAAAALFFAKEHLETLGECLKLSSASTPHLHSVWPHILRLMLPQFTLKTPGKTAQDTNNSSNEDDSSTTANLAALWSHIVEGHLLTSSHERKAVALQLLMVLLPHLQASSVPVLLSKAFVALLNTRLKDSRSHLHKAATRCVDRIVEWAQNGKAASADVRAAVLFTLSAYSTAGGGLQKMKALSKLSTTVDASALQQYAQRLMAAFSTGQLSLSDADESTKTGAEDITTEEQEAENAEAADKTRIWIIGHLCSVAQAQTCNKATAVEILQFLCTVAFVNNGPKGPKSKLAPVKLLADSEFDISEEVRNCAVARAASLATEGLPCTAITVSKDKIDEEKQDDDDVNKGKGGEKNAAGKKKGKGDMKQRHSNLLIEVSLFFDFVEAQPAAKGTLMKPDACTDAVIERLRNMTNACEANSSKAGAQPLGALLGMLRIVLCTDAADVAAGLVVDMYPVVAGALSVQLPVVASDAAERDDSDMHDADDDVDGGSGNWVHACVSCMLSMLSDGMGSVPVGAIRGLVEVAWRALCMHADSVALGDVLEVVARIDRSVSRDGDDMFEDQPEDEEEDDSEASDENEDDSDDQSDDSNDSDQENETSGAYKGNKKGKNNAKLKAAAVGKKRGRENDQEQDGEGSGEDGESSDDEHDDKGEGSEGHEGEESDEGWDDEAMFRIDKFLAKTFSSLKSGKQGAQAQLEAFQRFQLRALSLLEIWVRKQPRSPLVAMLPVPMLRALIVSSRPSGHKALAQRLSQVLQKHVAAAKPAFPESLDVPGLPDMISKVQKKSLDADGEKATEQAAKAPEPSDKMMAVLSKVMYYATREESKEVNEAGSSVYFMLLRSLIASAGGPEEVSAANTETPSGKQTPTKQPKNGKSGSQNASKAALCAKDAIDACIEEVFEKRKTLWGYSELNMFMSKAPESLPELMLPSVLDKACSARTQHLQLLALKVCNACMKLCAKRKEVIRGMKLEDQVALVLCHAVSAGYSNMPRRAEGLHDAAGLFDGLLMIHDRADPSTYCSSKHLKTISLALKQVEGLDGLTAKCKAHITRLNSLLQAKGPKEKSTKVDKSSKGDSVKDKSKEKVKRKREREKDPGAATVKDKTKKLKQKDLTQSQE